MPSLGCLSSAPCGDNMQHCWQAQIHAMAQRSPSSPGGSKPLTDRESCGSAAGLQVAQARRLLGGGGGQRARLPLVPGHAVSDSAAQGGKPPRPHQRSVAKPSACCPVLVWLQADALLHALTHAPRITSAARVGLRPWGSTQRSQQRATCVSDAADPKLAKTDPLKYQRQSEVAELVLGEDAERVGEML